MFIALRPSPLPPSLSHPLPSKYRQPFPGTAALSFLLLQRAQHVSGTFLNMSSSSRARKSPVARLMDADACWRERNAAGTWWGGAGRKGEVKKWRSTLKSWCPHVVVSPPLCVWCNSVLPCAVMGRRAVCLAQGRVCIQLPSALAS